MTRHRLVGLGFMIVAVTLLVYNETIVIVPYNEGSTGIFNDATSDEYHHVSSPPPPQPSSESVCSAAEMTKVKQRFTAKRITDETRCPDSTAWWNKYLYEIFFPREYNDHNDGHRRPLVAISFGCNKGDDAVATLRQLTTRSDISVSEFRQVFGRYATQLNTQLRETSHGTLIGKTPLKRACPDYPQPNTTLHIVGDEKGDITGPNEDVTVHCVEAMPTTAWILQQTANTFDWRDHFVMTHAAVGASDGKVDFPTAYAGIEHLGLSDCQSKNDGKSSNGDSNQRKSASCQSVPAFTVDTFVREKVIGQNVKLQAAAKSDQSTYSRLLAGQSSSKDDATTASLWAQYQPNFVIDFMAVDVEGYDWQVLGQGGADWTLHHTRYLEFEYHGTGAWQQDQLSVAIATLDTRFGFTCYWAGVGRLIRMTHCFQPYMEFHQWSNVACAHRYLAPKLAVEMERLYQETLKQAIA